MRSHCSTQSICNDNSVGDFGWIQSGQRRRFNRKTLCDRYAGIGDFLRQERDSLRRQATDLQIATRRDFKDAVSTQSSRIGYRRQFRKRKPRFFGPQAHQKTIARHHRR